MKIDRDKIEDLDNTTTPGSDNVYADLGYENPEEMLLKAHLMMLLSKAIKAKGLERDRSAEMLEIDRSEVSALLKGQFREYSLERLFKFLNAVDLDVEVNVKSKPAEKEQAHTTLGVVTG